MPFRRQACIITIALALLVCGCASQKATRTGFLSNYEALVSSADDGSSSSYTKPGMAQRRYTRFMLDPVVFEPPAGSAATLGEADISQLKMDLQSAIRQSFKSRFEYTTQPGPNVLRVRFAITGVDKSNPSLNVALAILIVPLANGGASTEAEVLDSRSGERLVAVVASSNGSLLKGEFSGFFSEFGHAKQHFAQQADVLRDKIIQALDAGAVLQN